MKDFKPFRRFYFIFAALVILFTGVSVYASAPKSAETVAVSQNTLPENSLLQFSAGGHILGFKPDRVYFASFDHAVVEEFVGTKGVMPAGEAGKGNQEDKKGASALGKVVYKNLWQGITLKYEARKGGIAESTYALEPEADVKNIKLKYNVPVAIEKDGSLRFKHPSENGYFSQSAPKAWQDIEGKRTHIEVAFADYGDNTVGFRLGEYNRQYPVVIDPTYQWHTFYGSAGGIDQGLGIAVDTAGNVYVTGVSDTTWNGPAAQAPLNAYSGGIDIVVLKLNTSGVYQWHTFYGSAAGTDRGFGIAVDNGGNIYVTGQCNATWGTPLNAFIGGWDVVALKLDTNGAYQWHTFYGSVAGTDTGYSIAVDTVGNVYISGACNSTWGAPLNAYSGVSELFVLKLNASGAYQWHTFYGSAASWDYGYGIAVDTGGNVYVTGAVGATWNGPGATAPLNAYSGSNDIFVLKLNTNGGYLWHTFYGSTGWDGGNGIAVDTAGNVYMTGVSNAGWSGPAAQTPLNAFSGGNTIVVMKLNTNGGYLWHTFYGAASDDFGYGLAVDTAGNVYVTGYTLGTWNGPGATAPLNASSGGNDIAVLKLSTGGAYQWHTFYGSAGADVGNGIAVDTGGNIYVAGKSASTWGVPLNAHSGGGIDDIAVLKLAGTFTLTANANGSGAGTVASDVGGINYTYSAASTGTTTALNDGTGLVVTATGTNSTVSWGGTCTTAGGVEAGNGTGTATCTFASLTANKTVTATFTLNTYVLTVTKSGTGTGTVTSNVGAINCGATCAATYNAGDVVTLTATPDAGSTFIWLDGICFGTGTCVLTMNSALTPDAIFTLNTYTVIANAAGSGSGTVASNTGGITYTYQTTNTGTTSAINYGTGVVVTATAGAGSTVSWGGTCTGGTEAGNGTGTSTCTIASLTANKTATATFTLNTYTVTPSAGANGTISPTTPQTINYGSTTTFTVTPNAGYSATVGGTCGGSLVGATFTTNAITANCTVAATFFQTPKTPRFAYVANYSSNTISMYTVDSTTGQLRHNGYVAAGTIPQSVTVDPTGKFAYVANPGSNNVSVYTINQMTGILTAGTSVAAGTNPVSVTVDPTGRFAYVANWGSHTISVYTINQTTGALTADTAVAAGTQPYSVTVDPTGRFAYVANSGSHNISVYTINQTTGALTAGAAVAAGTQPFSVTVDPSGKFAYVANYSSANVSVYTINQTTGALTEVGTAVAAGTNPWSVAVDPAGKFVYVANYGSANVAAYTINQTTGALTAGTAVAAGASPAHVVVDPSGKFAYVANQGLNNISVYTIDQTTGALTAAGTITTQQAPTSMTMTAGAPVSYQPKFAYVANMVSNNISGYTINAATGALTEVGTPVAAGTWPHSVTVDPSGRFAYAANWTSNDISVYTINQTTGALTSVTAVAAGTNPYGIAVDPSGKFAYAANYNSNNISVYTINQTTGALTAGTPVNAGSGPKVITVDPSGRFAYAANDRDGNISVYTINQSTGALSVGSPIAAGTNIQAVTVDPSGRFAYAANASSNNLSVYTIDQTTGALTAGTAAAGTTPHSVTIDPSGKFAYTANYLSGTISVYTIDQTTGALTAGTDVAAGTNPIYVTVDPSGKFAYAANNGSNNISVYTINQTTGALTSGTAVAAGTQPLSVTTTGGIAAIITYTVTPSAGAGGTISPSTAMLISSGSPTTFTVTPNSGYTASVAGTCGGALVGTTYTTNAITADCTVVASFTANAPTTYTVTTTAGAGGTISPAQAQTVNYNATTSFTVTPNAGYGISSVTGCGGALSGNTYTTGPITSNCTVSASFSADPVNGACGSANGGTFTTAPTGNLCTAGTASAVSGPLTSTWAWSCNGANGGTNASCSASLQSYTVTPSAGAGGSISPSGAQTVNYNAALSFTITPADGYSIDTLTTDCGGTASGTTAGGTYTTGPITANCTVTATFIINTFTVTPSAGTGGSISPATPQIVNYNAATSFTVTPDTGYNIVSVTGCGGALAGNTYTTGAITANCSITAVFTINTFAITTSAATGGIVSCTPATVNNGGSSACTITPDIGFKVLDVLVDGTTAGAVTTYTFSNVTANHTISAAFAESSFTVTPSAGAGGSISPATPQIVNYNATTSFTVTPDTGYNIASVTGCGGALSGSTYTTGLITTNCTIAAAFKITFTMTTPSGLIEVAPGGSFTISTAGASNVVVDGVSIGEVNIVTFINVTGPHTITW